MSPRRRHARFPWRPGNRFELLVDGPVFFERMLQAIDRAERHVLLELYLVESGTVLDRFAGALLRAAERGVAVRVLFDDFGARGLSSADRERLVGGGVELTFYNVLRHAKLLGNLLRDHRKLLVADGRKAFVGGAGFADAFHPLPPAQPWRETMLEIEGPVVADWQQLFAETWARCTGRAPALAATGPEIPGAGHWGRVVRSASLRHDDITRSVRERIAGAGHRAWIATAYFVPSWSLRRALRHAARRGVDVRLLLPGPVTDHPTVRHAGRRHYAHLLPDGVRIFEYQRRFLHAKAVLCDQLGDGRFEQPRPLGLAVESGCEPRDRRSVLRACARGRVRGRFRPERRGRFRALEASSMDEPGAGVVWRHTRALACAASTEARAVRGPRRCPPLEGSVRTGVSGSAVPYRTINAGTVHPESASAISALPRALSR